MCNCNFMTCIAPGVQPVCLCKCHDERDRAWMLRSIENRENERCSDCRWQAYECGIGRCYCQCHGDRPVPINPNPVVEPGHDEQGHERTFAHLTIVRSADPDLDVLLALHAAYTGTHPEWTIGGSHARSDVT